MKLKPFVMAALCSSIIFSSCKKDKDTTPAPTPDPAQTITSISPTSGPKNTVVTITGTNFGVNLATLKVYFNGVQATVQTATNTSITAVVPAGAGIGIVKVEKSPGVQVNGPTFTYFGNGYTTTFVGNSQGYADGTGTSAQFNFPTSMVKDGAGNFFVADRDNHRIRKITPAGVVTTFAGSGTAGFTNGTGAAASFNQPYALAIDASNNLYVGDRLNYSIRKITAAGIVTTIAGNGVSGMVDATGSAARFGEPIGLAVDAAGNIFVGDYFNNRIRKITAAGVVTTFAGSSSGFVDGTGTAAAFNNPFGLAFDAAGNLYVADSHNFAIRKVTTAGVVTTLAGNGSAGSANGTGSAATFSRPIGITVDANGNVYECDLDNHTIRKITAAGVVTTFAGTTGVRGATDGVTATFDNPVGVFSDNSNSVLYVADFANNRIRKIIIE
ncbi:IPT/TIG domain-containing protein [Ferruginibacter sp.]|nr:gluconolactonase [Ferruginibacter sp.]